MRRAPGAAQGSPADEQSGETSPAPPVKPEEPKGGPLAKRAFILCGQRAFQVFLDVGTADEARNEVCRRCGVASRAEIDHDDAAAKEWVEIDLKYRLWVDGYD